MGNTVSMCLYAMCLVVQPFSDGLLSSKIFNLTMIKEVFDENNNRIVVKFHTGKRGGYSIAYRMNMISESIATQFINSCGVKSMICKYVTAIFPL